MPATTFTNKMVQTFNPMLVFNLFLQLEKYFTVIGIVQANDNAPNRTAKPIHSLIGVRVIADIKAPP